jgi:hypothetical protein
VSDPLIGFLKNFRTAEKVNLTADATPRRRMSMFEIRRLKNQAMRNVDALFCLLLIITAEREADAVFRCDTRSPA